MKGPKSWREKMEGAPEAKLVPIPPRMHKQHGKGTMLIPNQLREKLARSAGADITRVTPYWRVVKDDGRLLETVSSGPAEQARHTPD
jgi:hypothetical protein